MSKTIMKKQTRFLALVMVGLVFTTFTSNNFETVAKESTALAKCATREFNEELKYSTAVFVGKVLSIREEPGSKKIIEFKVTKYWKGIKTKKVEVNVYETSRYQAWYEIGKNYLVYARNDDGKLMDGRCSRSREIGDDFIKDDLKKLGKGKKYW